MEADLAVEASCSAAQTSHRTLTGRKPPSWSSPAAFLSATVCQGAPWYRQIRFGMSFSLIRVERAGNSKCCAISHGKCHLSPWSEVSCECMAPNLAVPQVFLSQDSAFLLAERFAQVSPKGNNITDCPQMCSAGLTGDLPWPVLPSPAWGFAPRPMATPVFFCKECVLFPVSYVILMSFFLKKKK